MRRPQGYAVFQPGDGSQATEVDTFTCAHCNRVVPVPPRGGQQASHEDYCAMCDAYICPACAGQARCTPFEKQMEEVERRDRLLRAAGSG